MEALMRNKTNLAPEKYERHIAAGRRHSLEVEVAGLRVGHFTW